VRPVGCPPARTAPRCTAAQACAVSSREPTPCRQLAHTPTVCWNARSVTVGVCHYPTYDTTKNAGTHTSMRAHAHTRSLAAASASAGRTGLLASPCCFPPAPHKTAQVWVGRLPTHRSALQQQLHHVDTLLRPQATREQPMLRTSVSCQPLQRRRAHWPRGNRACGAAQTAAISGVHDPALRTPPTQDRARAQRSLQAHASAHVCA
jgi:hypothetical protein